MRGFASFSSATQQCDQTVRIVGDDAIHTQIEQPTHIIHLVDRPGMHFEIQIVCGIDESLCEYTELTLVLRYLQCMGGSSVSTSQEDEIHHIKQLDFTGTE